ncbi:MAG TPA: hypothetical protein VGM90_26020 [Kofleriaceae bacterium]|jgi:hypothetical protein
MHAALRCLALAFALVAFVGGSARADGTKLVIVVAKGSKLTSISRSDLKRCFLGESIESNDKPLVPFNTDPSTPTRTGFDKGVLGMSPDEVGRFWVDRKVRGQSGAPRSLPSVGHVAKVVAKFPNAIGYLPEDQLTADVQPVSLDGVSYKDANYPLRSQ